MSFKLKLKLINLGSIWGQTSWQVTYIHLWKPNAAQWFFWKIQLLRQLISKSKLLFFPFMKLINVWFPIFILRVVITNIKHKSFRKTLFNSFKTNIKYLFKKYNGDHNNNSGRVNLIEVNNFHYNLWTRYIIVIYSETTYQTETGTIILFYKFRSPSESLS